MDNEIGVVLFVALVVGLSTFIGGIFVLFIKEIPHKVNDAILSFAAGVMLSATFFSLISPALEYAGGNFLLPCLGIFAGAILINLFDRAVPHIHNFMDTDSIDKNKQTDKDLDRVILFLIAIAIHNFPEGLAVGVSFGTGNISNAYSIAIGISIQNVVEGFITILPLIAVGVKYSKAFLIAFLTGLSEVVGVVLGYFTVSVSVSLLPFILALAGGAMLYVISHDMIPETHSHGHEKVATYSLVVGVASMIIIDSLI